MFSPPKMMMSFRVILDNDVAVLVEQPEIAGVKPAACKCFWGGFLVLQIAFHDDVAAEHDLADGLAAARHCAHGVRIKHGDGFLKRIGHALPALELRALFRW